MADCGDGSDLEGVAGHFALRGKFLSAAPYGSGHINDTYAGCYDRDGAPVRYIHQRINHSIFKDPVRLMENISRVTRHVRATLAASGADQIGRRTLTLVPTLDGASYHVDGEQNFWRTYEFIEEARTFDQLESEDLAFAAAKAFGAFQCMLADFPEPRLNETIPGFHDTPRRYSALMNAVERDPVNRAADVEREIAFASEREACTSKVVDLLDSGVLPERITHNDTKLNNVMIDDESGEGICVIDLDTVMPGCALYDFGDMVRSATNSSREDERDVSRVKMRMNVFKALAAGYLASAGEFLTPPELDLLVFSGRLITFEIGLRFLTDYLGGDTYFKTSRPGQNLDRCRVQFELLLSMESQADEMEQVVLDLRRGA